MRVTNEAKIIQALSIFYYYYYYLSFPIHTYYDERHFKIVFFRKSLSDRDYSSSLIWIKFSKLLLKLFQLLSNYTYKNCWLNIHIQEKHISNLSEPTIILKYIFLQFKILEKNKKDSCSSACTFIQKLRTFESFQSWSTEFGACIVSISGEKIAKNGNKMYIFYTWILYVI